MTYIAQIGLLLTATGLFLLSVQILYWGFENKENKEKYQRVSAIPKSKRLEEEQKYIDHNWHSYYLTRARNFCFKAGIPIFVIALLLNSFIK